MTRVTHMTTSRSVLADVQDATARLERTRHKLTSGREIGRPSDDPVGTQRALSLRADLEARRQYQRNVDDALAWSDVADVALDKIGSAVHRARELVIQGASDTSSQSSRNAIALEIDQLVEAVKHEANATHAGRYVFSGTNTTTRPYSAGPVDSYAGNTATIAREIGPGVSIRVNTVASEVLGSGQDAGGPGVGDDKLLDVLRDIADDLRSGNGNALRGTDLGRLDANLDEISRQRATVGATANRLEIAGSRLAELEESAQRLLSETEDADMAKAMVDFSMQQSVYQAALKSGANIVQASLLDFLR